MLASLIYVNDITLEVAAELILYSEHFCVIFEIESKLNGGFVNIFNCFITKRLITHFGLKKKHYAPVNAELKV